MKHQYFGDINDYRKYGLLRLLSARGKIRTAVCWMLTDSDGKSDGKKTKYLSQPKKYRKFDPDLFDILQKSDRNVESAERGNIIPSAVYHPRILTDKSKERTKYFAGFQVAAQGYDLVFFDPDNGIEVGSMKYGATGSSKYLYWQELIETYHAGHSVLVYQHFPRAKREEYKNKFFRDVCKRLNVADVIMFTTSNVLFVLIPPAKHLSYFTKCAMSIERIWDGEIKSAILPLEYDLIDKPKA